MKILPILFKPAMAAALWDGRKTQTRRVISTIIEQKVEIYEQNGVWWQNAWGLFESSIDLKYQVGDLLYVRESHYLTDDGHNETCIYTANEGSVLDHLGAITANKHQFGLSDEWAKPHLKKRPSIHMPRWASRQTLEVTAVRVERLQDISEVDAVAEGIHPSGIGTLHPTSVAIDEFRTLWDSINVKRANGKYAWDNNPWVAVYEFTHHKCNVDQMEIVA